LSMTGNDHIMSEVAPKTPTKTDRPAPDLYTGEPPLQSAQFTALGQAACASPRPQIGLSL